MNQPGLTGGKKRIGLFGGAFDPPHNAHLALATAAIAEIELDRLHVIPTGHAWHKARTLTAPEHRLAMTHLAFSAMPAVVVDDREIKRAGPTFTIDTLRALQAENPGAELYLLMGADQWAAFERWHEWPAILKIAIICVAARVINPRSRGINEPENAINTGLNARLVSLDMPQMPVSATQIRQRIASGLGENQAFADLLPASVAGYISKHHLYQHL